MSKSLQQWQYTDYDEYVEVQIAANIMKQTSVWVQRHVLVEIRKRHSQAEVGSVLCHGVRNGAELDMWRELYKEDVLIRGTEISPDNLPENVICHDMQKPLEGEWKDSRWDLVYSNSFDHAMDPKQCLQTWCEQVSDRGALVIDLYSVPRITQYDPLYITPEALTELVPENYFVESIRNHPLGPKAEHQLNNIITIRKVNYEEINND